MSTPLKLPFLLLGLVLWFAEDVEPVEEEKIGGISAVTHSWFLTNFSLFILFCEPLADLAGVKS